MTSLLLACSAAPAATVYVWQNSPSPGSPYNDWSKAAHTIQEAVDAATVGDTILVTNGLYATGARSVSGGTTNRVAVDKSLLVKSVNGPEVTVIQGQWVPGTTNGAAAIRCVYLANAAVLSGFTLTNGATRASSSGGGVYGESANALVNNCILTGNAAYSGGGASYGTLSNCTLTGNLASTGGGADYHSTLNNCTLTGNVASDSGGGAYMACTLNHCTLTGNSASSGGGGTYWNCTLNNCTVTSNSAASGGGACYGTLNNCTLKGNSATNSGGGAYFGALTNCTLTGNLATNSGGGAVGGTLNSCVLTSNSASVGGGADQATLYNCTLVGNSASRYGGGASLATMTNCVVYYNNAPSDPNYDAANSVLNYCCTTPRPWSSTSTGNMTTTPSFVNLAGGNLRLQSNSLCINAGNNASIPGASDLDGRPRIVGGTVDMGAYEYQGAGMGEFIGWLTQYQLPTDGSADSTDADADRLNNWQEWVAHANPTNAASTLLVTGAITRSPSATVASFTDRRYTLLRCTALGVATQWNPVVGRTDIPGTGNALTLTDPNPPAAAFYRISVRIP